MNQAAAGKARTTQALRKDIQASGESIRELSRKYGLNRQTVTKWKRRDFVLDAPRHPRAVHPGILTAEDENLIIEFRRCTLLPLEDCHYALKQTIPYLTRSSLYRCLKRNGISRLPTFVTNKQVARFDQQPGTIFLRVSSGMTEEGPVYLYSAIDPVSRLIFCRVRQTLSPKHLCQALQEIIELWPYRIAAVNMISDDLCPPTRKLHTMCEKYRIRHVIAKPNDSSWFGRPVKLKTQEVNRKIASRYATRGDIIRNMEINIYHFIFQIRLKSLGGQTPFQHLLSLWRQYPLIFKSDPHRMATAYASTRVIEE